MKKRQEIMATCQRCEQEKKCILIQYRNGFVNHRSRYHTVATPMCAACRYLCRGGWRYPK